VIIRPNDPSSPIAARSLARSLTHHGFDVLIANTAAEALASLRNHPIDIILLDWILPDHDGVALLQDFRERGIIAPVIMLSAEQSVPGRVRALNRGADDFISKPFEVEEVIARVHANLRRQTTLYHVTRVGRVSVDAWKQEAMVDGQRVDLTPLEFSLLSYLMRSAGETKSKQQILETVWGDKGAEGSLRALDLQLLRLRRKLGTAASQIETVRGSGIRFIDGNDA